MGRGVLGWIASVLGGPGTLYADHWACVPSLGGGGRTGRASLRITTNRTLGYKFLSSIRRKHTYKMVFQKETRVVYK